MDLTQQTEPIRRTFLDVLRDNLRIANKRTFVHRLIYIGEHKFHEFGKRSIGRCMEKTILKVNNDYHDEPLSGILLVYPKYFCHILEGSEDSIIKHFKILTSIKQYTKRLGRTKLLVCYHHCNQRFFPGWLAVTGKPPTLLERIDIHSDLQRSARYVYQCVSKLYKLALLCKPKIRKAKVESESSGEKGTTSHNTTAFRRGVRGKTKASLALLLGKNPDCLPEYGLLDFLLTTSYTQNLKSYIDVYGIITPLDAYKDKVWPVPCEFVPLNIFDKPYDPVEDLPTAKIEDAVDMFQEI